MAKQRQSDMSEAERTKERWQEEDTEAEVDGDLYETDTRYDIILQKEVTIMTTNIMDSINAVDDTRGLKTIDGFDVATALMNHVEHIDLVDEATGEKIVIQMRRKPTQAQYENNMDDTNERVDWKDFTGKHYLKFIEKTQTYKCSNFRCENEITPGEVVTITYEWDNPQSTSRNALTFLCKIGPDHDYTKRNAEYTPAGRLHDSRPA